MCENIKMNKDQKQRFLPDDYIFKQGEKGDKAYLLLDGRVAIEVNGKKVAEISEMEIFGEMSLILNKPRTASIKALKPSIVLPINQKILSRNNDPIIVKILCAISALVVFFILVARRIVGSGRFVIL
mgnify:CR=1 FL=1